MTRTTHLPRQPIHCWTALMTRNQSLLLWIHWPGFYLWPQTTLSSHSFWIYEDNQILTSLPLVPHTWVCNSPLWVQPSGLLAAEGNHGSFQPSGLFLFLQKSREEWSDGSGCSPCLTRSTMGKGILEFKGMHPGVSLSFALLASYLWKWKGQRLPDFTEAFRMVLCFLASTFTVAALNSCTMWLIRCRKVHWVISMFEGGSRELAQGSIWSQKLLDSSPYMEVPWPGPSLWQNCIGFLFALPYYMMLSQLLNIPLS